MWYFLPLVRCGIIHATGSGFSQLGNICILHIVFSACHLRRSVESLCASQLSSCKLPPPPGCDDLSRCWLCVEPLLPPCSSLAGKCDESQRPVRLDSVHIDCFSFPFFFCSITFQKLYKIKPPGNSVARPPSFNILSRCTFKVGNGPGWCRMCECWTSALCRRSVQTDTKSLLSRQRTWAIAKAVDQRRYFGELSWMSDIVEWKEWLSHLGSFLSLLIRVSKCCGPPNHYLLAGDTDQKIKLLNMWRNIFRLLFLMFISKFSIFCCSIFQNWAISCLFLDCHGYKPATKTILKSKLPWRITCQTHNVMKYVFDWQAMIK